MNLQYCAENPKENWESACELNGKACVAEKKMFECADLFRARLGDAGNCV